MQANRIHIEEFLSLSKKHLLLDVRSPSEYVHAHIPGAVSFPLFSDEERKIVGTAYKQESRERAIKIGLDFFGPKMRTMVEKVEQMLDVRSGTYDVKDSPASNLVHQTSNIVCVYCWRGGMRSGAVSWLLNLYGFKVYTLAGGYKAFRNYVLKSFAKPFHFKILGGYTGSGKTAILKELETKGEAVIDLEKIASHKGSAFGNINMPAPPTQEMFENLLSFELQKAGTKQSNPDPNLPFRGAAGIWLEDESQRIGNLNIPIGLWQTMRNSPLYFLEIPFEERLNYIVEEYGQGDLQKLMDATQRISKRLGGLETKNTIAFLEAGNIKEAFRILLHYYDKRYLKGLHNREDAAALINKIACEKVTTLNAQALLNQYQTL
ncbi:MAG: tRNA 2-selenouridine(34) synthase MnmH [Flavisolibacter sp.]